MKYLQFSFDHWGAISGWLVAAYHVVVNAGGLKTIWQNFAGIKPISPDIPPRVRSLAGIPLSPATPLADPQNQKTP